MAGIKDLYQAADWKKEKHVPVIEAPDAVKKGDVVRVTVSVGKEIPHPNTTPHHIRWIEVYFPAGWLQVPLPGGQIRFHGPRRVTGRARHEHCLHGAQRPVHVQD